jgi:hypothetical protein
VCDVVCYEQIAETKRLEHTEFTRQLAHERERTGMIDVSQACTHVSLCVVRLEHFMRLAHAYEERAKHTALGVTSTSSSASSASAAMPASLAAVWAALSARSGVTALFESKWFAVIAVVGVPAVFWLLLRSSTSAPV